MTTIRLTFLASRYHATPWGRHVNEGVAEWPPSPYRLLRALYDVWQRKCFELPETEVRSALEALAISPPRFILPRATATHTRSYLSANSKDPTDKNLVFDSFVVFDRPHACYLCWDNVELSTNLRRTVEKLLRNLNYLGRSESWVEAELSRTPVDDDFVSDVYSGGEVSSELATVACAVSASDYDGKVPWLDALKFSTSDLLKQRTDSPPLLRKVRYVLPDDAVSTDPPRPARRRPSSVQALLLGLDGPVLPLVTATLEVSEQIRVRLMGSHKRIMDDETRISSLFSGKGPDGKKHLGHEHVYVVPLGNHVGRIEQVLIVSPLRSFTLDELDAARGVRSLWQRDGRPDVRCVITWQGLTEASPVKTRSKIVETVTPFVPPRHWRKGRDFTQFLVQEVHRECLNHRIGAEPSKVELLKSLPGLFDVVEYRRNRKDDPIRPGYAVRITFEQEVLAPFTIGYGAHFGLGQFRPSQ